MHSNLGGARGATVLLLSMAIAGACGDDVAPPGTTTNTVAGTGGALATGGAMGTAGVVGTGGAMGTAGVVGTGGVFGSGGGGGGGGSGGSAATGGAMGAGGVEATGGAMGSGGSGGSGGIGGGTCCADGNCICRGEVPGGLTSDTGPHATDNYSLAGIGCIYYPTDAQPPYSAVAISDGYGGSGGCGRAQTSGWGSFYASHGIVTMIVETTGADQPPTRGSKLLKGIDGFKAENDNAGSPLYQTLAGRYGTSGFSMGGGGTTYASSDDPGLLTSVALMPWGPTSSGITVPTLVTCGSSDTIASCRSHGTPLYSGLPDTTPKIIVTLTSSHAGQPTSGRGMQGAWGLAFQKLFLDGDERWRTVLLSGDNDDTNIR